MRENNPDPVLHRIPSVAKLFECAPSTVWALIKDKQLKTVKFGGSTRIADAEIQRFIDARQA